MSEKQEISLEQAFAEIETIIQQMEQSDMALDESFKLYESGVEKLKICTRLLGTVEKKMQMIRENGTLEDF